MRRLIFVPTLLFSLLAGAQGRTYYGLRHFGTAEGLPDRLVRSIAQDDQGFIWLATPVGAVRFDGLRFTVVPRTEGLPGTGILDILRGPDGLLWMTHGTGTGEQGLAGIDLMDPLTQAQRSFADRFGKDAPCAARDITSIVADSAGALVLSTVQGDVLTYFGGGRFRWSRTTDGNGSRHWLPVANGYAGVLDNGGKGNMVRVMDHGGRTRRDHVFGGTVRMMLCDRPERDGIRFFTQEGKHPCQEYWLAPDGALHALGPVQLGDRWIKGLRMPLGNGAMLADAQVREMGMGDEVAHAPVLFDLSLEFPAIDATVGAVFRDRAGRIWLGSDFGVYQLTATPGPFQRMLHQQRMPRGYGKRMRGICVHDSLLYVNTEMEGAYVLNARTGAIIHGDTTHLLRYALAVDRDGTIWSWEDGAILHKSTRDLRTLRSYPMAPYRSYVWSLLRQDSAHWLLGTANGLRVLDAGTGRLSSFGAKGAAGGLDSTRVEYLGHDRQGRAWACTVDGLYLLGDRTVLEHWRPGDQARPLPVGHVLHFMEDGNGIFWLGTMGGGLVRLDRTRGTTRSFGTGEGLPSNIVYAVQEGPSGLLWASTDHGLVRFDPATGTCATYTTGDGIGHDEFNRTAHAKGPDGRMYFGGLNGITAFDPKDIQAIDPPMQAPLAITAFRQYDASSGNVVERTTDVVRTRRATMLPGDRSLQLDLALLTYTDPASITYGWRIGADGGWSDQHDPQLIIGQLPYGEHVLYLRANVANGKWAEQTIALAISVLAPLYLRWWFLLLIVLLLTAGIAALFRYRLAQARKVFAVRDRIAADLHDEIGSTLSSVALYGAVARQHVADPDAADLLDRITDGANAAIESMNDIVWSVNSRFDGVDHLFDRMRAFAVRTAEENGFALKFILTGPVDAVKLDMEQRKNLYLFFREAVHNVAKHAACSTLDVGLAAGHHRLLVRIADDGRGMGGSGTGRDYAMGANGLVSMRKRADALHGRMELHSPAGKGTTVSLEVPL